MNGIQQIRWVTGCLLALLFSGYLLRKTLGSDRHPLEGLWQSHYYTECMCGSQDFWLFRHGKIISYSDKHLTDYATGSYEDIGSGQYKVIINQRYSPPLQWIVHPGKDSWIPPAEGLKDWFHIAHRQFHRIEPSVREEKIIKDAPERDERFKAIIKRREANNSVDATARSPVVKPTSTAPTHHCNAPH